MYYLLTQPADLRRLKEELYSAIKDPNHLPPMATIESLPFLTACIKECLRVSNGVSTRLPRISPQDPVLFEAKVPGSSDSKQYVIPPGTPMSMTGLLIHSDESIFPDPMSFTPQRWLDDPHLGKYLVPFSRGTRQCIGMNLAYAEIYLTLAGIFRQYGSKEVKMEGDLGYFELYQTDDRDVKIIADGLVPLVYKESKGIRIVVQTWDSS